MKGLQIFIGLIALFITLPLNLYGSYLLYKHVHATEIMWFIWWINLPVIILTSIITTVVNKLMEK
jgi:hypothetical protein